MRDLQGRAGNGGDGPGRVCQGRARGHRVIVAGRATVAVYGPARTLSPGDHLGEMALTGHSHRSRKDHRTRPARWPSPIGRSRPPVWPAKVAAGSAARPDTELANMRISSNARAWQSSRSYSALGITEVGRFASPSVIGPGLGSRRASPPFWLVGRPRRGRAQAAPNWAVGAAAARQTFARWDVSAPRRNSAADPVLAAASAAARVVYRVGRRRVERGAAGGSGRRPGSDQACRAARTRSWSSSSGMPAVSWGRSWMVPLVRDCPEGPLLPGEVRGRSVAILGR